MGNKESKKGKNEEQALANQESQNKNGTLSTLETVMKDKKGTTIPSDAENIVIVLGQCLLLDGGAHPFMQQRTEKAYSLLKEHKLDFNTTYFIVSGSDVSNTEYKEKYGTFPDPKHISEAEKMQQLLVEIHRQNHEKDDSFKDHILLEDRAMTTIQNFYYVFLMIIKSNMRDRIKQIFIVTSDFHMKRAKYNFDTMFYREKEQMVGNEESFQYEESVHFEMSETISWKNEKEKIAKFKNEDRIINAVHVIQQVHKMAERLWTEMERMQCD